MVRREEGEGMKEERRVKKGGKRRGRKMGSRGRVLVDVKVAVRDSQAILRSLPLRLFPPLFRCAVPPSRSIVPIQSSLDNASY